MTLSHVIDPLPSGSDIAFNDLHQIMNNSNKQARNRGVFETIEKTLHGAFMAAERAVLSEILS